MSSRIARDVLVDVIGAYQRNDNVDQVYGNNTKSRSCKSSQRFFFENGPLGFAACQRGPGVTAFRIGSIVCHEFELKDGTHEMDCNSHSSPDRSEYGVYPPHSRIATRPD